MSRTSVLMPHKSISKFDNSTIVGKRQSYPSFRVEITNLPVELLIKIFSFLNANQICHTVAGVCKTWYNIAYVPTLWRELTFFGNQPDFGEVKILLTRSPFLQRLYLKDRRDVGEVVTILSENCHDLEILSLQRCWSSHNQAILPKGLIRKLKRKSPKLKRLKVIDTPFTVNLYKISYEDVDEE